mmetsp:Transcript_62987/g.181179  ORF Transcript_62987/g.181179 Transcript_62987/m.181179 type:complete len:216 (-) Transcript_62987:495-1142(-)
MRCRPGMTGGPESAEIGASGRRGGTSLSCNSSKRAFGTPRLAKSSHNCGKDAGLEKYCRNCFGFRSFVSSTMWNRMSQLCAFLSNLAPGFFFPAFGLALLRCASSAGDELDREEANGVGRWLLSGRNATPAGPCGVPELSKNTSSPGDVGRTPAFATVPAASGASATSSTMISVSSSNAAMRSPAASADSSLESLGVSASMSKPSPNTSWEKGVE